MGDDVEIEEIFDADLLSGSEDEEEANHQEEALLGVDAVRDKFTFPSFCFQLSIIRRQSREKYSISRSPQVYAARVTLMVLLQDSTRWTLMGLVTPLTPGTLTQRMRGSRRGGRGKYRLLISAHLIS